MRVYRRVIPFVSAGLILSVPSANAQGPSVGLRALPIQSASPTGGQGRSNEALTARVGQTQWKRGMIIGALAGFVGTIGYGVATGVKSKDAGFLITVAGGVGTLTGLVGALVGAQTSK